MKEKMFCGSSPMINNDLGSTLFKNEFFTYLMVFFNHKNFSIDFSFYS